MLAGKAEYFSKEHYESVTGLSSPELAELVVHCLELVSQLAAQKFPFRFKGGNSLLLILPEPTRFSIDVDIVTTAPREDLIAAVEEIVRACPAFLRHEIRQHQTKPWLPMISFKLFFKSFFQAADDAFVMLDAVLEEAPYPGETRQVVCGDIYRSEMSVETPSRSGLIADKLLTLGPATLGIPLGKKKEAQRLKHVYDIASLLRGNYSLELVRQALESCLVQETRIQKKDLTIAAVLADTRLFLEQPARIETTATPDPSGHPYLAEIAAGYEEFRAHIFRTNHAWTNLQEDCRLILSLVEKLEAAET